jgi:diacylglycerol kinase (ATP)
MIYDEFMHRHIRHQATSFRQALQGVSWAFYTQPHFQFHIIVGTFVIILAFVLRVSIVEVLVLLLTIFFILVVELLNTAIEATINLVTDEWQGYAKVAKDVSAGAVLIASIGSVLIGSMVFVPKFLALFSIF